MEQSGCDRTLQVRWLTASSTPATAPREVALLLFEAIRREAVEPSPRGDPIHLGMLLFDTVRDRSAQLFSATVGADGSRESGRVADWVTRLLSSWNRHPSEFRRIQELGAEPARGLPSAAFPGGRSLWIPVFDGARLLAGGLHLHASGAGLPRRRLRSRLRDLAQCSLPALHRSLLVQQLAAAGCGIVPLGVSPAFLRFEREARLAAWFTEGPVLVRGERGSGKELAAWSIHCSGPRRDHPFVPVLVSALPESLYSSELFGHARRAFTGAGDDRLGRFRAAEGGTLFLDEVADMPPGVQSSLMRVLERGEVTSLGRDLPVRTDVQVIAATHFDLQQQVDQGRFRADLHDRLRVLELATPPLRERRQDIPLLATHFLRRHCRRLSRHHMLRSEADCHRCNRHSPQPCATPAFFEALQQFQWPGNIRELRNVMMQVLMRAPDDVLDERHLPARILGGSTGGAAPVPVDPLDRRPPPARPLALEAVLREHIQYVMGLTHHNLAAAARLLEIPESTLRSKMTRLGLR